MNNVSIYALPDLLLRKNNPDIIYTPSLIERTVEFEFNIPYGKLWFKTRSVQFSIARYSFLYILQIKIGLEPAIIRAIYGVKHDKCYQARHVIQNILDTKTPRHHYVKIKKLLDKIKRWDISEITLQMELLYAGDAELPVSKKTLKRFIEDAHQSKQQNAPIAIKQAELNEQ